MKLTSLVISIAFFCTIELGAVSLDISISKDSEDSEQFIKSTKMYMSSSDLELGENKGTRQVVGLRFKQVNIPKNAKILDTYVQFTADEKNKKDAELTIYGEKATYSSTFSNQKIMKRKKTNTNIEWYPEPWVEVGAHGENQKTPNLSSIIEEIIDQPNWKNTIGIIIQGTGVRTAESFSGSKSKAPKLHIEYTINNEFESWCDDSKYVCVTNAKELTEAVNDAKASDTIILKEGTYNVHHLEIKVPHVTIASQYYLDQDKNHIKKTILKDSDIKRADEVSTEEWLIDGGKENSEYLSIIGLTINHVVKGIGFQKGHGLVDNCHVDTWSDTERGTDAISFENVLYGGGEVRYSSTFSRDEGVDLDTSTKEGNGTFKIHHNYFKGKKDHGDDLIEMRIMTKRGKYEVEIYDNIFDSAHGNAIQFIDYGAKQEDYLNKTTIKIHHNIIKNSNFSGIDTTLDQKSSRIHEASNLAEEIIISNNYFYNNNHHIDGGENMHIENNIFNGDGKTEDVLAWVKGKSTIKDNIFFKNNNNYYESNDGSNDIETDDMADIINFAQDHDIKIK